MVAEKNLFMTSGLIPEIHMRQQQRITIHDDKHSGVIPSMPTRSSRELLFLMTYAHVYSQNVHELAVEKNFMTYFQCYFPDTYTITAENNFS